jgi:nucleotide-binding universal stress UspA family protein
MSKPVVVGIDGSPESFSAADWAGREAMRRGLPVHLLNVWQNPVSTSPFSPDPEELRLWQEDRVREAAKRLTAHHPGLAVTMQQIFGTPAEELPTAAAASEMMIIGSRALGGTSGFVYGSVGLPVVARSDRPVVVVRSGASADRGGGGKVVLGLPLGRPCDSLVSFAFEEAAARGAVLHAVHVWDERALYGYAAPSLDSRLADDLRAERGHELAQVLAPWRAEFSEVELEESVLDGRAAEWLIEAGRDSGTDLLAVGRCPYRPPTALRLGPVTHGVLHHATCPVAVVSPRQ